MGFNLECWELALDHLALDQTEGGKGNEQHRVMGEYGPDGGSTVSLPQRASMNSVEETWELEVRVKSLSSKGVCPLTR